MIETDLAWAAGIFDGEGCLRIYRSRHGNSRRWSYGADLRVRMTGAVVIHRLREIFGVGAIRSIDRTQNHLLIWEWRVGARDVLKVLPFVRPYLVLKAREADLLIEMANRPRINTRWFTPEVVEQLDRNERMWQECQSFKSGKGSKH